MFHLRIDVRVDIGWRSVPIDLPTQLAAPETSEEAMDCDETERTADAMTPDPVGGERTREKMSTEEYEERRLDEPPETTSDGDPKVNGTHSSGDMADATDKEEEEDGGKTRPLGETAGRLRDCCI